MLTMENQSSVTDPPQSTPSGNGTESNSILNPTGSSSKRWGWGKTMAFSLIPTIMLLLLVELSGRVIYYQLEGPNPLVWEQLIHKLQVSWGRWQVEQKLGTTELPTREQFFTDETFDDELKTAVEEYRYLFNEFYNLMQNNTVTLYMLYIPPENISSELPFNFFQSLADQYQIPLIDMRPIYNQYPKMALYNTYDGHPVAFGHHLVAQKLQQVLDGNLVKNQGRQFSEEERPESLGMWIKNEDRIYLFSTRDPFYHRANSQGLRALKPVKFPRNPSESRIMILGDSFAYGHGVNDENTISYFLERMIPDAEVINAGFPGMSIYHELTYMQQRGQYVEPDILILQVLDNDLHELLPHMKRIFDYKKGLRPKIQIREEGNQPFQ